METPNPTPEPASTEPTADERTWAMMTHLGSVLLYFLSAGLAAFLCPLVIWIIKKDESEFVAEHAKESLNFQISFLIVAVAYFAISIPLILACGIGIILLYLSPLLIIVAVVLGAMASAAANRGESYRYPYTLRLIP